MVLVLSLPEFTGSFAIITNILGIWVGIWGTSHGVTNAALDFFRRPDHVVEEKHLLQYLLVWYASTFAFWSVSLWQPYRIFGVSDGIRV